MKRLVAFDKIPTPVIDDVVICTLVALSLPKPPSHCEQAEN